MESYGTYDTEKNMFENLKIKQIFINFIENKRGFAVDNVFLITHNIDARRIVTPTGGITLDILFLRLMFLVGVFIL